jgi:hypothetical protein
MLQIIKYPPVDKKIDTFYVLHNLSTGFSQKNILWTNIMHTTLLLWINFEKALRLLQFFDIIFVFSLWITHSSINTYPQSVDKLWIGYPSTV